MANIYVRSTDGSDANNGTTWALAKATLSGAAAIDAAGDTIYLSQAHSESSATTQSITLAGTLSSPVKIIAGDDSAEPPTATSTAIVTTTGSSSVIINGCGYVKGVTFNVGSGNNVCNFVAADGDGNALVFENCNFYVVNTSGSSTGSGFGSGGYQAKSAVKLLNCNFKFAVVTQCIIFQHTTAEVIGGGITAGGSALSYVVNINADQANLLFKGFDFSALNSTVNLLTTIASPGEARFVNCKLPAFWTGNLVGAAPTTMAFRASMYNCDSGATNYRLWIETYAGSIKQETTLIKTGGASDGTTGFSWKMTTNANANEYVANLVSDTLAVWNDTTGSSKTVTIDILHDSATNLTDAQVWIGIDYLGSSATPLSTFISDKRATVLTTAADQTASSATWTTTGMSNPNKQKLEVTFTPQMKGFIYIRVYLVKASYILYIDPLPVIS